MADKDLGRLTRANVTLVTPEPYINESSGFREYSGTLLAGSSSISLLPEAHLVDDEESVMVVLNGVVQIDYTLTNSSVNFSEAAEQDLPYKVFIGISLARLADRLRDAPKIGAVNVVGSTATISLVEKAGDIFYLNVDKNITFSFITSTSCKMCILVLENGGSHTVTWPSNLRWPNGVAPTLTSNGIDYIYIQKLNVGSSEDGYFLTGMVTKNMAIPS